MAAPWMHGIGGMDGWVGGLDAWVHEGMHGYMREFVGGMDWKTGTAV